MNHATSVVIVLFIFSVLLFAVMSNTSVIYSQQVLTNTTQVPPPSSSIHRLHAVKITSPTRGQQVPIGNNNLTISGVSIANATSHCQVSVLVNDVWPYQAAIHTGPGGASDYSQWNFVLSSKYTTIKPGPANKITARYTCRDNPAAISFYSVNITGAGTTTTPLVGAAPHANGPSSTAANKNTTNANGNLTAIPSTNNQPAERTTHASNPAANKNTTNANGNLTAIPSTNNQPAERTTHASNQPAERTTHASNQPAERTTHASNQPAERTTHVNKVVKITSHIRGQQEPIVVQCLKCLVIKSTNSSTGSKMVTTDNTTSHGQVSIIVNGLKQYRNVAGIIYLGHHGSSGGISRHHKPMATAGSGSGSSDNRGPEPGGKASNGNNVHNKGNLRENYPLNNSINELKNTITENANRQLKIREVQLPLPLPFPLP
jgi:hypothetical protein